MKVLVDTSVWSIALRHSAQMKDSEQIREQLFALIDDSRVAMIGPIRQELLLGIKSESQFNRLKKHLEPFRDTVLETDDFILAAKFFNQCRKKGIQGAHIDFLICAICSSREYPLFTADKDFLHYKKHIDFPMFAEV